MAAKLENCTKEKQRSVIGFCGQKVHQVDIFISACVLSMETMLSRRVMYEWIEIFKNGRPSVTDAIQPQPQPHRMKKEVGN
jgi:hypothetical protein